MVVGRVDQLELFPYEIAEVGDRVPWVPDEEVLGLLAVVLVALDVRQNRGDLAVWRGDRLAWDWADRIAGFLTSILVRNDFCLVVYNMGDGTVRVAEGDTDDGTLARLNARFCRCVTHFFCLFSFSLSLSGTKCVEGKWAEGRGRGRVSKKLNGQFGCILMVGLPKISDLGRC